MAQTPNDLKAWAERRIGLGLPLAPIPGAPEGIAGETLVPTDDGRWAIVLQCGAWSARRAPARLAQLQQAVNRLDRPGHRSASTVFLVRVHAGRWALFELPLVPLRVRRPGVRYWLADLPGPGDRLADGRNTPL